MRPPLRSIDLPSPDGARGQTLAPYGPAGSGAAATAVARAAADPRLPPRQPPQPPPPPRDVTRIDSQRLFAGTAEVQIEHHGVTYRLKQTALGKLILTK